LKKTTKILFVT